jgi:uncharacterized protein
MDEPQDNQPQTSPPVWKWTDVLMIVAGIALIFILGILSANLYTQLTGQSLVTDQGPTIELSVALTALEAIALIGAVYWLGLKRKNYTWEVVGLRNPGQRWLRYAVLIGLVVIPGSGLIAILVQQLLGLPADNPQLPFLAPGGYTTFGAIGMFLFGGVIVPFAEELFFRGVLYLWMRQRFGYWPAILVSSILFGILHGDISVGVAAAVLGLVLAWIYEKSQSLWTPVIIHVLNNAAKILLLYLLLATGIDIGM